MSSLSHVPPTPLTPELYDYALRIGLREPTAIRDLREETATLENGEWSIAPEQGPLLALFVGLLSAKQILEVGTFTGASTLWMANAMPAEGRIIAMDVSDEFTSIAKRYWARADVSDRIDLRLQPAIKTLDELLATGKAGTFDLAFIDADKGNVGHYYDRCLSLIRPGGLILVDNTLWDGKPSDPGVNDESTIGIRELNERLHSDERVELCFLTMSDGLTVCRKR